MRETVPNYPLLLEKFKMHISSFCQEGHFLSGAKLRQETETLDLRKIMSTGADQKVCSVREYVLWYSSWWKWNVALLFVLKTKRTFWPTQQNVPSQKSHFKIFQTNTCKLLWCIQLIHSGKLTVGVKDRFKKKKKDRWWKLEDSGWRLWGPEEQT